MGLLHIRDKIYRFLGVFKYQYHIKLGREWIPHHEHEAGYFILRAAAKLSQLFL